MSIFNLSAWVRPPSIQFSTSFDLTWHLRSFWASMVPPFPLLLPPFIPTSSVQFCKRPTHRRICCHQEDYEALQHAGPLQTHLSRAQAPQAHSTRKRSSELSSLTSSFYSTPILSSHQIISLSDVFISPLEDMCVQSSPSLVSALTAFPVSYFVTELLGTDLHRLLTSRPLEKQFIQYFLYQILVSTVLIATFGPSLSLLLSADSNTCTRPESSTAIL